MRGRRLVFRRSRTRGDGYAKVQLFERLAAEISQRHPGWTAHVVGRTKSGDIVYGAAKFEKYLVIKRKGSVHLVKKVGRVRSGSRLYSVVDWDAPGRKALSP